MNEWDTPTTFLSLQSKWHLISPWIIKEPEPILFYRSSFAWSPRMVKTNCGDTFWSRGCLWEAEIGWKRTRGKPPGAMEMFRVLTGELLTSLELFGNRSWLVHVRPMHIIRKFCLKKKKSIQEQMKWKRQDSQLGVSDPKAMLCLLFGYRALASTASHRWWSRWATSVRAMLAN